MRQVWILSILKRIHYVQCTETDTEGWNLRKWLFIFQVRQVSHGARIHETPAGIGAIVFVFISFPSGGIAFCYGRFSYSSKLFWRHSILIDADDIVDIVQRLILKFPLYFIYRTPRSSEREAVSFIPCRVY